MAFQPSLSSDSFKESGGTLNTMEIPSTNGEPKSTSCNKACVPESVTSAHLWYSENVPFTGLSWCERLILKFFHQRKSHFELAGARACACLHTHTHTCRALFNINPRTKEGHNHYSKHEFQKWQACFFFWSYFLSGPDLPSQVTFLAGLLPDCRVCGYIL